MPVTVEFRVPFCQTGAVMTKWISPLLSTVGELT